MRVLFVTDFYHPYSGGVEIHVRTVAHELLSRGHDVAVATLPAPDRTPHSANPDYDDDGGVEIHTVRHSAQALGARFSHQDRQWAPPFPDPLTTSDLRRVVRRFKPDVIHGHDWLARSALSRVVTGSVPIVTSLHYYTRSCAKKTLWRDDAICPGPSLKRCLPCSADHYGQARGTLVTLGLRAGSKLEDRRTKRWISVSSATEAGNELSGQSGSIVIPNPVPTATALTSPPSTELTSTELTSTEPVSAELTSTELTSTEPVSAEVLSQLSEPVRSNLAQVLDGDEPRPFILYVGDIRPEKGVAVLAKAVQLLRDQGDTTPLVVVGERMSEAIDLPDQTIEVGHVDNEVVQHLWRLATVGAIPSQWPEPFGLVAVEAMAAGCAIVASRVGGLAEILADDRAELVEPGDPTELATTISRLLNDPDRRRQLSAAAVADVGRYAIDSVVDRIEEQYREVTARP